MSLDVPSLDSQSLDVSKLDISSLDLKPQHQSNFLPTDLTNLELWLDSSDLLTITKDGGDLVSQIDDKSGNLKHLVQATSTKQPLWLDNIQNGLSVLRFDGVDNTMNIPSITLPTFLTVFIAGKFKVAKPFLFEHSPNANSNDGFFIYSQNPAMNVRRTDIHQKKPLPVDYLGTLPTFGSWEYDGEHVIRKEGVEITYDVDLGTPRANSNITDILHLASRGGTAFFSDCDIYEILIYGRPLTFVERINVEGYISTKWGL